MTRRFSVAFSTSLIARRSSIAFSISLIACAFSLFGCQSKEETPSSTPTSSDIQEVTTTRVTEKTLSRIDQLPGEITAYQDVAIYPKVPGFIEWIGVDRGSKVKKGQLMVRLIAPELNAQSHESFSKAKSVRGQLHEAESRLASARATLLEAKAQLAGDNDTYVRTKDASNTPGVVAPNDVVVLGEKVEADKEKVRAWQQNVDAAENAVKALKDSLVAAGKANESYQTIADYLKIYAPFDGYVTERNMHVGSFVGPLGKGAYPPIVRVQELDLLRIVTPVPEINVSGVVPGAEVEFTVSTHPGEKFKGKVARIGNYLDQKTRTMPVELNYWNPGWRVLPGMFCEVLWPTRRPRPSLFVPATAVDTTSTLATFVIKIENGEVVWVPVNRGELMGRTTEVFGKLKAGDEIALNCTDSLRPGTKVKTIPEKTADETQSQRPSYSTQGTFYQAPTQEIQDLKQPENKGKTPAF